MEYLWLSDNQMPDLDSLQVGLSPVRETLDTIYLERNPGVRAPLPPPSCVCMAVLMRMCVLMAVGLSCWWAVGAVRAMMMVGRRRPSQTIVRWCWRRHPI